MRNEYYVEFVGPFSWLGHDGTKSIFDTPEGKLSGIYIWSVEIEDGELVYYVGKTNRHYSQRMLEHFKEHLAGFYHINSLEEFKSGKRASLWNGMYLRHKSPKPAELFKIYPTISSQIIDLAKTYRFFIAALEAERRILERIECALAKHLYKQPGLIGEFQETGLNYRSRLASEQPGIAFFKSSAKILGLPESLEI
ncbi:MAG: hypothetical protein HYZ21_06730 [Chloroflexi bacterium]|nr:hypothetical protein [Chloroflexota bacterium]